ncbi:arylesterase [Granulosicoccus antarcticus]|uniref:Esterase TesA n=1 Tax=Granulosicoccus antarcticus IMCC3135 TaxID=1192854 RepID=A0A2Z2P689_9GAMM|nr:arylesterase [Granulosicoccus antarcticus]ASJ75364.1 Esterase TesA [Granulosicoccus antarcticus IMCC3135]
MRFTAVIRNLLFLTLILGANGARAESYTVLVMGDSIGAAYNLDEADGWVNLLGETLREEDLDVEMVNASISGDTTSGGLRRLPDALDRFTPDLLVIELGGNDGLRGYPPKNMQKNLEDMANIARERDIDVLILGMLIPTNYGNAYLKMFAKAFSTAAENTDSTLIPFLLEPIAQDRAYFQADGIHPTAEAQPLLMKHTLPFIRTFVAGDS